MLDIVLTDLIDVQVLQKIQNGFSKFTGMAALTTDAEGNPITEGSGFTDFCMDLTRSSRKGFERCAACDKKGALLTLEQGKPVVYDCHAGLVDFAAPIMVEGTFVGSFIGGQVRTKPISAEEIRKTAAELEIDAEAYLEAARKVNVIEYERAEQAAEFLSEIAAVLSEMAYNSYVALQQSKQLERVARSHNNFIVDMNAHMKQHVLEWISTARELQVEKSPEKTSAILEQLMERGEEFLATIDDTVEFSKIASGEIELNEKEYNIYDLINGVRHTYMEDARERGSEILVEFDAGLPEILLGDAGRINQIVTKLVRNAIRYTENGTIVIRVSSEKKSYATNTVIQVSDTGKGMSATEWNLIKKFTEKGVPYDDGDGIGITIIPMLLAKMSGTFEVDNVAGKGTTFTISIPQLDVQS